MMHMNIQDSGTQPGGVPSAPTGPLGPPGHGQTLGSTLIQLPSLPPEFMHAVAHQITHQAMVAAVASAAAGQQVPGFPTAPTRVVIARPTPPQARPSHPGGPPVSGPLQGAGLGTNPSLAQMVSGLVGQLLMQPVLVAQGTPGMAPPPAPATASASAGTTNTATTAGPAPGGPAQPPPPQPSTTDLQFSQLLGNLLGPTGPGAGGPGMVSPTITVAMPGVPAFLQGMTDFLQATPTIPPSPATPPPPPQLQSSRPQLHQACLLEVQGALEAWVLRACHWSLTLLW